MYDARFLDPFTKEIMANPVIAYDGFIYDRSTLDNWNFDYSPMNHSLPMKRGYVECIQLRNEIEYNQSCFINISVIHFTAPEKSKYSIKIDKNKDIEHLKECIYCSCWLPAEGQVLFFNDVVLNENKKMVEYGINDSSVIVMKRKDGYQQDLKSPRICPLCHIPFNKDSGCAHMTCQKNEFHSVDIHWCYRCASGESIAYTNSDDCRNHINSVHPGLMNDP